MANSFFQFQQFSIQQDRCAMKVTTEASLFGAWVADMLRGKKGKALDIGTGTGLLSLILAQETFLQIDAIEIDEEAAKQAKENIETSLWKERITILNLDLLNYSATVKYDVIISNPPFYETDLPSPREGRRKAHHGESLTLSSLVNKIEELLKEEGEFFLLFPAQRKEELIRELKLVGLYAVDVEDVFNDERGKSFRVLIRGSRKEIDFTEKKFYIRNKAQFSESFRKLMLPYYLPQALQQNQKDIRSGA